MTIRSAALIAMGLIAAACIMALSACGGTTLSSNADSGANDTETPVGGGAPGGGTGGGSTPPATTVQQSPFRLCFDADFCTTESGEVPAPQPYLYAEGPRPQVNPGTITAFPAFGWVVGTTENELIPSFIWQGNRLSGRDQGTLYEVTGVAAIRELPDRTELDLSTNYSADTALMSITNLPSGAVQIHLTPPPGMAEAGIAVSMFSFDSPEGEGLFGMGARKDFFNQRGKLRNVWTEQQNTGLGAIDELDLTGVGAFGGSPLPTTNPTADFLDSLGINPDADDPALAEERTSFPNGAQAAYWVEAFVVGSRGWAAWTEQKHFQRIDLAATRPDRIRWQIVDSDDITLLIATGSIEEVSRTYTAYWGRATPPGIAAWQPWIDTLNQGEGEAAPNGQGFWGGQRARCEIEDFIAKSAPGEYDIPFGLIGVEGWQVIPQSYPSCTLLTTEQICSHSNGFPFTEAEWQAEVDAGTSFLNVDPGCAQANQTFFDYVKAQGFEITGYWNFFTTNHNCDGDAAAGCVDDQLGVPFDSKLAYYEARGDAPDRENIFVQSASGGNHEVTTNRGGISSLIDFTNPASVPFWEGQLSRMLDQGIDIFMHDFGELTTDAMRFHEGENITESHNLFAFRYQQAARQALDEYAAENAATLGDDFGPYYFARAGMTGACSFTPGVFPGDESTSWDQGHGLPSVIPTMLNLALSGCYAFSTDIGGYFDVTTPRTTEDLFIRWSQLAALTPTMRIHSSTFNGSVFPWTWAEGDHADAAQYDTPGVFARYARLKVNLIPLIDHWVQRAASNGDIGPVRPIILEDLSPAAMAVDYQWLLGNDLLVAPVVFEDATSQEVYFPTGSNWTRVIVNGAGQLAATGDIYNGGTAASVPLDAALADIPLFLRCGSNDPLVPALPGASNC